MDVDIVLLSCCCWCVIVVAAAAVVVVVIVVVVDCFSNSIRVLVTHVYLWKSSTTEFW